MSLLHPVKDISEYKRLKETLRDRFENERMGDQDLFIEQAKIFQPLITTQLLTNTETVKAIKDSEDMSSTAISNALLPVVRELERREQADSLMVKPFYREELPAIAQASPDIMKVDLDGNFNEIDLENLQDMSFDLPSVALKNKTIEETLEKRKTENKSIGQKLGKASKLDAREIQICTSEKILLKLASTN